MSKHARGDTPVNEPNFFAQLEPDEHRACRDYLWSKEIVRRQRILKRDSRAHQYTQSISVWDDNLAAFRPGETQKIVRICHPQDWLATRVAMIRKAWELHKTFTSGYMAGSPPWSHHPATQVMVLWPEWPRRDYFDIPTEERLRRIEALSISTSKTMQEAVREDKAQLAAQEYIALMQIYAPKLLVVQQTRGRSEEVRVLNDLNASAVYQLCEIEGLPRIRANKRIRFPKGHKDAGELVYGDPDSLNQSLKRFERMLPLFLGEVMGNLVPLEPETRILL